MPKGWIKEPRRHSLAAKGIKTAIDNPKEKVMMKQLPQIGDFKSPNKYWVSWTDDFIIYKDGSGDWASDSVDFKSVGSTNKIPFKSYEEARKYADELVGEVSPTGETGFKNTISIEDRYSGEVYTAGVIAIKEKTRLGDSIKFDYDFREDLGFTKKEMIKRKEDFK